MYGLLGVLLCWVPVVGLILSGMGLIRAHRAGNELLAEPRFQGQRLVSIGLWLSIVGAALGVLAMVYWLIVLAQA